MARPKKPAINLCRLRTDRFRDLTVDQLKKAQGKIGRLYEIPKRDKSENKPRYALSKFLSDLIGERTTQDLPPQSAAAYRRNYGSEPASTDRIRKMYRDEANRMERKLWELQQKAGCSIPGAEQVARDAAREGRSPSEIDFIRGRRRPRIR